MSVLQVTPLKARVSPAPAHRRRTPADLAVVLAFFLAPMSAYGVGGVRFVDLALILSVLLVAAQRPSMRLLPVYRDQIWAFIGFSLLAAGTLIGRINGGAEQAAVLRLALTVAIAGLPLLLVGQLVGRKHLIEFAAFAFVAGTCVSVVYGLADGGIAFRGRSFGLATHMNQLAMTTVMAAALLLVRPSWTGRRYNVLKAGALVLLAYGLFRSGSRSGALAAAAVTAAFCLWQIARSSRGRFFVSMFAGLVLLGYLTWGLPDSDPGDVSLFGRLSGESVLVSDGQRADLYERSLDALSWKLFFVGDGSLLERSPHNVLLEALLFGGVLALVGLLLVWLPAIWPAITGALRPLGPTAFAASAAVLGYVVAVSFNNALWTRFAWCIIALQVATAVRTSRSTAQSALQGSDLSQDDAPPRTPLPVRGPRDDSDWDQRATFTATP